LSINGSTRTQSICYDEKERKAKGSNLQVPELGERVSRGRLSGVLPVGTLVSFLVDVDKAPTVMTGSWNPDIAEPNPSFTSSKPCHLDPF